MIPVHAGIKLKSFYKNIDLLSKNCLNGTFAVHKNLIKDFDLPKSNYGVGSTTVKGHTMIKSQS